MLSIVILASYLAAALWLMAGAQPANVATARGRRIAGVVLAVLGLVAHAMALWQGIAAKPGFAWTVTETASAIGLGIAAIATIAVFLKPTFAGTSAVLLILAGVVGAATNEGARTFVTANSGWELNVHIALSVLAYTLLTVGAALAIVLTLLDHRLRRRQPLGALSVFPSVEALESWMFRALGASFAVLSLALFSGFFFVEDLRAQNLSRKAALSLMAWICLGILLIGRWRFGWRGRKALYWTLSSFALLALAYFGSKVVLEWILGRHWG
ncbi:MAG: cytochrome c biogenesis protein CcsA [Candidatus Obscuribacterales bacterium]|nr:cytochrome c biogenesis protein CcsA [Steroidobacteraceae bacterium]